MIPCMEEINNNIPEVVGIFTAATPAADHLFQVRNKDKANILPEGQAINFHHTVSQLSFVSTRACRDTNSCSFFEGEISR